ncbi:MAG: hypothetical protein AAF555_05615 [Verrucomicrobiota bacterium]
MIESDTTSRPTRRFRELKEKETKMRTVKYWLRQLILAAWAIIGVLGVIAFAGSWILEEAPNWNMLAEAGICLLLSNLFYPERKEEA